MVMQDTSAISAQNKIARCMEIQECHQTQVMVYTDIP